MSEKTAEKKRFEILQESLRYSIALQKAIEHHCNGQVIPEKIASQCPHHAKMLNGRLLA